MYTILSTVSGRFTGELGTNIQNEYFLIQYTLLQQPPG